MTDRRGEKLGWTLGFLGSTAWMFVAAAGEFFAGDRAIGVFTLFAASCVVYLVVVLAPWRRPSDPFWKLIVPPVAVMMLTVGVLLTRAGQVFPAQAAEVPFTFLFVILGMLARMGWRRWEEGEKRVGPAEPEL